MSDYDIGFANTYLKRASNSEVSYSLAGRLTLSNSGWLILTVPASLIRGSLDALHETSVELPDDFGILVMTPQEVAEIPKISERGHSFQYNLGSLRSSNGSNDISKLWYICIYSRELIKLRKSYNLSSYPLGSSFFRLPIGVRKVTPRQDKKADFFDSLSQAQAVNPYMTNPMAEVIKQRAKKKQQANSYLRNFLERYNLTGNDNLQNYGNQFASQGLIG